MNTREESDMTEPDFMIDFEAVIEENPVRFYTFCFVTLLICFLCHLLLTHIHQDNLQQDSYSYLTKHSELPDDLIQNFVHLESTHELDTILSNITEFPLELVELSVKNHETIPFVANYLHYMNEDVSAGGLIQYSYQNEIPLFLQWDPSWGYSEYGNTFMALSGCAPTVVSMAVAALTDNDQITPRDVADYAQEAGFYVDGIGTSWDFIHTGLSEFGLVSDELPLSATAIFNTLHDGDLIIVSMAPGTFTMTGHFLLLTGVTEDNQITLHDPNSQNNSNTSWPIDVFLNETKNLWRISAVK